MSEPLWKALLAGLKDDSRAGGFMIGLPLYFFLFLLLAVIIT